MQTKNWKTLKKEHLKDKEKHSNIKDISYTNI